MDQNLDIPRWLKDELGLIRFSEAHLNNLTFHPRHGTLCRRLITFLVESTLCGLSYPDVYAKEDYLESEKELELTKEELVSVCSELDSYIKENENLERDLVFLTEKVEHLRSLEDLVKTSTEALSEVIGRPNVLIEQVPRNLANTDYLSENLSTLYPTSIDTTPMSARQTVSLDEQLEEVVRKVSIMSEAIANTYRSLLAKIHKVDPDLKPISVKIEELLALKTPEVDEVLLDPQADERELINDNSQLSDQVHELALQVAALEDQFKAENNATFKTQKERISKCLSILEELDNLNSIAKVD